MALPRALTVAGPERSIATLLLATWWLFFAPFLALVTRFSFERACADPYELLQPVMQRQAGALAVAAIYVGTYVWCLTAATLTLRGWNSGTTIAERLRSTWGPGWWKVMAVGAALAVEQVPRAVWHWIYSLLGVC